MNEQKTQTDQIYMQKLYNYIEALKQAYIEYKDLLYEMEAYKKATGETELPEEKEIEIKSYLRTLRQATELTYLEYQTLVKTKRHEKQDNLDKAYQAIEKSGDYLIRENKASEYLLEINAYFMDKIMPNMLTSPTEVYDKK